jgi:hypothetical protein
MKERYTGRELGRKGGRNEKKKRYLYKTLVYTSDVNQKHRSSRSVLY